MSRLVRKSKKMYRRSKPTAFGVKESNKKLSRWGLPCAGEEDGGRWHVAADECGNLCLSKCK